MQIIIIIANFKAWTHHNRHCLAIHSKNSDKFTRIINYYLLWNIPLCAIGFNLNLMECFFYPFQTKTKNQVTPRCHFKIIKHSFSLDMTYDWEILKPTLIYLFFLLCY